MKLQKTHRIPLAAVASYNSLEENANIKGGKKIKIPGMGYQIGQAWFFMDDEAFNSLLVQGYFMENLILTILKKFFQMHGEKCINSKIIYLYHFSGIG